MSDYQHSISIDAAPEDVFNYVSNIKNLPDYLSTVQNAEPQSGERVRVQGEVAGHSYDVDGYFHVDKENMRIEWGADEDSRYRGWLSVEPNESSRDNTSIGEATNCQVAVHVSFAPRAEEYREFKKQSDFDGLMNEGIQKALFSIKNYCEGIGGKVESRATTQGKRR